MDKLIIWVWTNFKKLALWACWAAVMICVGIYFYPSISGEAQGKTRFVSGSMIDGHYQIENQCGVCHKPFGGIEQEACLKCHAEELKAVRDSHSAKKFKDPRNADKLLVVNALLCVTCHKEHKPRITRPLGVTLAKDFCFHCHAGILKSRPTHKDLGFDTCVRCHNYHDNQALYEDFLAKHLDEPENLSPAQVPLRDLKPVFEPGEPLTLDQQDAPANVRFDPHLGRVWETSSHARGGVNCKACHRPAAPSQETWTDKPDYRICVGCHTAEGKGFLESRHGMRLNQDPLSPMQPEWARAPLYKEAAGMQLTCMACHQAHKFNSQRAAVQACLICHKDEHSVAFRASPHYKLWLDENEGLTPPGSGVSCATCHLPRVEWKQKRIKRILVQHNQNANLRPNQKMIRDVCMKCHGLGFSIDSLADRALITRNFSGKPAVHLESLEMTKTRLKQIEMIKTRLKKRGESR